MRPRVASRIGVLVAAISVLFASGCVPRSDAELQSYERGMEADLSKLTPLGLPHEKVLELIKMHLKGATAVFYVPEGIELTVNAQAKVAERVHRYGYIRGNLGTDRRAFDLFTTTVIKGVWLFDGDDRLKEIKVSESVMGM